MKVVPSEQATQRDDDTQDQTKPEDHHATDGHEWPESWSGATAWQSWGNWSDWTWGAGWHKSDWKSDWDQQPLSQEHVQWRNRTASLRSYSEDSQSFYGRGWSKDTLETPAYRKSGSLDSELAAAFQRLDTVDRLADSELPKVALDKSLPRLRMRRLRKSKARHPARPRPTALRLRPFPSRAHQVPKLRRPQAQTRAKAKPLMQTRPSRHKAPQGRATTQATARRPSQKRRRVDSQRRRQKMKTRRRQERPPSRQRRRKLHMQDT